MEYYLQKTYQLSLPGPVNKWFKNFVREFCLCFLHTYVVFPTEYSWWYACVEWAHWSFWHEQPVSGFHGNLPGSYGFSVLPSEMFPQPWVQWLLSEGFAFKNELFLEKAGSFSNGSLTKNWKICQNPFNVIGAQVSMWYWKSNQNSCQALMPLFSTAGLRVRWGMRTLSIN